MFFIRRAGPVCGIVAAVHAYNDESLPIKRRIEAFSSASSTGHQSSHHNMHFDEYFPRTPWDFNWDQRDPLTLLDPKTLEEANEQKQKEMLAEVKPTATRNVILIRHGQYQMETKDKFLTPLGREQAALVGERLANSGIKFTNLVMSTMNRATETANIILTKLPSDLSRRSDSLLEEGAPYPPEPSVSHWKPFRNEFFQEGSRIEAAFRNHIHRASPKQKEDSYEVIVCHANVIRFFVCRALQFPPEGWLRMSLGNCSITWLVIRPNGRVSIRSLGDIGHLPPGKISFS